MLSREERVQALNAIKAKYASPPRLAKEEETAIAQSTRVLLNSFSEHYLKKKENKAAQQPQLKIDLELDTLDSILKKGQLSLVADQLDDNFLNDMEEFISNCDFKFETPGGPAWLVPVTVQEMYEKWKKPGFSFSDTLIKMYTDETPYCYRMNAVCAGYADNPKPSKEEKAICLLLSLASQKAGLKKAYLESQEVPKLISRGAKNISLIQDKLTMFEHLDQSKLSHLKQDELQTMNISSMTFGKKLTSTTTDESVAKTFATQDGFIIKIANPEDIGDFYDISNISAMAHEKEAFGRAYDDVVLIPFNKIDGPPVEIEVFVMRSAAFANENNISKLFDEQLASLEKLIKEQSDLGPQEISDKLKDITEFLDYMKLITPNLIKVVTRESDHLPDNIRLVQDVLETSIADGFTLGKELAELGFKSENISTLQKINSGLGEVMAVFANLSRIHEAHQLDELYELAETDLKDTLQGFQRWAVPQSPAPMKNLGNFQQELNNLLKQMNSFTEIQSKELPLAAKKAEELLAAKEAELISASKKATVLMNEIKAMMGKEPPPSAAQIAAAKEAERQVGALRAEVKTAAKEVKKLTAPKKAEMLAAANQIEKAASILLGKISSDKKIKEEFPKLERSLQGIIDRSKELEDPKRRLKSNFIKEKLVGEFNVLKDCCDNINKQIPSKKGLFGIFGKKENEVKTKERLLYESVQQDLNKLQTGYKTLPLKEIEALAEKIRVAIEVDQDPDEPLPPPQDPKMREQLDNIVVALKAMTEKIVEANNPHLKKMAIQAQKQLERERQKPPEVNPVQGPVEVSPAQGPAEVSPAQGPVEISPVQGPVEVKPEQRSAEQPVAPTQHAFRRELHAKLHGIDRPHQSEILLGPQAETSRETQQKIHDFRKDLFATLHGIKDRAPTPVQDKDEAEHHNVMNIGYGQ